MRREIKFRAKAIDDGMWIFGWPWRDRSGNVSMAEADVDPHYDPIIDPDTMCQSVGLTDNGGAEIFENDILRNEARPETSEEWLREYRKRYPLAVRDYIVQWHKGSIIGRTADGCFSMELSEDCIRAHGFHIVGNTFDGVKTGEN